jgi:hypothetical protein
MAQAVTVKPSANNQILGVAAWTDIPGMTITILNGSGWIEISYSACLQNQLAGANDGILRLTIDGIEKPDSTRQISYSATAYQSIAFTDIFKTGAGTHTYKLQGYAINADVRIPGRYAQLVVKEPGF